jgi:hypothetical protein
MLSTAHATQYPATRTLQFWGHKREGKRSHKNCHDDIDDLASIGVTFVDERSTKTER